MVYAIDLESIFKKCWFKSDRRQVLATVSKNIITYSFIQNKKLFLLIVTPSKGWGLISCQDPYVLIKDNFFFYAISRIKSYSSFISIIFLGFQKGYFQYLTLKGLGYKFICLKSGILLKFGFSHRIIFASAINTKCNFITRHIICLEARDF
jgi:hypothetical protein